MSPFRALAHHQQVYAGFFMQGACHCKFNDSCTVQHPQCAHPGGLCITSCWGPQLAC